MGYLIRPCCHIGHGQPKVNIYINFVKLEFLMLHGKFQDHKNLDSDEDEF